MKTLNEIARDLKDFVVELQSDAHNRTNTNVYRYNNLKLEIVDPLASKIPQVKITIGISDAIFNIDTGEKLLGGLGPDERYVMRWFMKSGTITELKEAWKSAQASVGKVTTNEGD